ncbi:MAG: hypothetical protein KGQ37_08385 [Hyphomicrobiales bacterium]|nr:hypothetical protein [Hyphomicrobiales bacterium]
MSGLSKCASAATLALIVGGAGLVAPARAQLFNFWNRGPAPWQQTIGRSAVNAIVYQRGLRLLRPAHRNGGVYVADTVNRDGHIYRLIIDAANGRVLEIFNTGHDIHGDSRQRAMMRQHNPQGHAPAHDVLARVHIRHVARPKVTRPHVTAQPKTLPKADIPVEAAMPAPVAKPKTAAIAPASAKVVTPAARAAAPVPASAAPVASKPAPAATTVGAPAPAAPPRKINDVPVAPLD